jgi:hypothetical protein
MVEWARTNLTHTDIQNHCLLFATVSVKSDCLTEDRAQWLNHIKNKIGGTKMSIHYID